MYSGISAPLAVCRKEDTPTVHRLLRQEHMLPAEIRRPFIYSSAGTYAAGRSNIALIYSRLPLSMQVSMLNQNRMKYLCNQFINLVSTNIACNFRSVSSSQDQMQQGYILCIQNSSISYSISIYLARSLFFSNSCSPICVCV